jgi:hypothetical protein
MLRGKIRISVTGIVNILPAVIPDDKRRKETFVRRVMNKIRTNNSCTHRPTSCSTNEVNRPCDVIIMLYKVRVIFSSSTQDITRLSKKYQALFASANAYGRRIIQPPRCHDRQRDDTLRFLSGEAHPVIAGLINGRSLVSWMLHQRRDDRYTRGVRHARRVLCQRASLLARRRSSFLDFVLRTLVFHPGSPHRSNLFRESSSRELKSVHNRLCAFRKKNNCS